MSLLAPAWAVAALLHPDAEREARSTRMAVIDRASFDAEQRGEDTVAFTHYDSPGPVSTGLPPTG